MNRRLRRFIRAVWFLLAALGFWSAAVVAGMAYGGFFNHTTTYHKASK